MEVKMQEIKNVGWRRVAKTAACKAATLRETAQVRVLLPRPFSRRASAYGGSNPLIVPNDG